MSAASTQPPADLHTLGRNVRASISSPGQQPSWLGGFGGRLTSVSGLSLDSHASGAHRQPSLTGPALNSHTFSAQEPPAAASRSAGPSAAAPQTEKKSFLVQQPSSKLWMEAVPMRVGTKATTTYRVYSNAFMEGRQQQQQQQEGRLGRNTPRLGIPSIQSTSSALRQPSWSRSGAPAPSKLDSAPRRGQLDAAGPRGLPTAPPQRQASFDLKQSGHTVAERMLQRGYVVRPRREDVATESQGHAASAASTGELHRQASTSTAAIRRHDSGSPAMEAAPQQQQPAATQLDQERQLAALLSMQDLSGASLLSSAEAQGSSNLIYILKTLQDHGGMNPQRLLQQLQAAMKESPMQQVLLMHMLQESLSDPDHGQGSKRQATAIKGRPRYDPVQDRYRDSDGDAAPARPVEPPFQQQRPLQKRISHEEMEASLRRVGSESEQLNAARNMAKPGSVSRLGRDMGPEPARVSKGPPLQGPSMEHRAALPGTAKPQQPAPTMPRLVFRDTASPDEQHKRVNPFEGLRTQQYKAAIGRDAGAVQTAAPASEPPAAAPEAARRSEQPAAPPAVVEEHAVEEPTQEPRAPVPPKEGPESLRQAAKMLLCLNSTEPVARKDGHLEDGDSTLVAAAGRDPRLVEDDAANAGNAAAATVSPLQALVQDIMQQQKQRAQESAMAKLPTGVSRIDRRSVDRPAAVGSDEEERLAPGLGRKRAPRMMGLNREVGAAPAGAGEAGGSGLVRHTSGSRLSVLGFSVPSAPRTGHIGQKGALLPPPELPIHPRHSGYGATEGGRRRGSGSMGESSGARSEPGTHISGASLISPAERRISHSLSGRRVTRPVLHESSGDFTEESSENEDRSNDSDSWDTTKEPRHRRRRRKR
ncbi:g1761 [Coccomyxa elongata]